MSELPVDDNKADCYSAGDRAFMVFTQKIRAIVLKSFLMILSKCGITADTLTLLSLIVGLADCGILYLAREN